MASTNPWPTIHAERQALVSDLEQLTDKEWATPSLCTGWSVRDVLGHMTATAKMTPAKFLPALAGAGFRFHVMSAKAVAEETVGTGADTLARFKAQLTATTHPPGPIEAMVGEAIVHGEDIRRPLGIHHTYPTEALVRTAAFYARSNLLIGGKRHIAGLALQATDADWSMGTGPEVSGPLLSLVLAIAGRPAGLDDLSGDGLIVLKARI